MNRRIAAFLLSLVMILSLIVIVVEITPVAKANIIYVGGGGPFNFSTIQSGISAANIGDTVFVYSGVYYENLMIDKTINLTGEDKNTTIIDGGGTLYTIRVNGNFVNITNFTILNGWDGINLYSSSNSVISNNNISSNLRAIFIDTSSNIAITNNDISFNNWSGIYLSKSLNNVITDNKFEDNGIFLWGDNVSHFDTHTIPVNNIVNGEPLYYYKHTTGLNIDGISVGELILVNCTSMNINNLHINNTDIGLELAYSTEINITNNNFSSNSKGIYLYSSSNNSINNNIIPLNKEESYNHGIYLFLSSHNSITNNIILNWTRGINIRKSSNNVISNNNVSMNHVFGIIISEFSNNTIISNNTILKNGHPGICIDDSSNISITGNNVSENSDYGIEIADSTNNKIADNKIQNNSFAGIFIWDTINHNLTNNVLTNNGIYIGGNSLESWNSHEIDTSNTVNGKIIYYWKNQTGGVVPSGAGEIILANCTNVIVENQNLTKGSIGIELGFSNNNTLLNNNVSSNNMYGIYLDFSNGNTISKNTALSTNWTGIILYYSNNNSILNNDILYSEDGMDILHSDDNVILGNDVKFNEVGISASSSNRNYISGNNANSNFRTGIALSGRNNTISKNNASSNDGYGLTLYFSQYNTIIQNNISYNNECGLYTYKSDENNMLENQFFSNECGININYSSSNNNIYHNNFISNTNQALEEWDYINQWDNGYPQGGNYWSDYVGSDIFKGPLQDILGSDDIGDIPYKIDPNSYDYYPLMQSYTNKTFENSTILKQGWNLVSVPLIQTDKNLSKVLEMINGYYDAVQWHNNTDENDPWKHNKIGKSFGNDLFELTENMSFWIHITKPGDTIFIYNGTQPASNQTIQLYPGWNMVGYPSLISHNRTTGLNNLTFGLDVDVIQWYNAATKTWHFIGPDDSFEPGRGYWVHSNVKKVWEVPL
jgi:parallel beta-helix repeat protein